MTDEKLSEHFYLSEALHSDTAARLGIDNTPTPVELERIRQTAQNMELVRAELGHPIHASSWFRSRALNAKTPGSSDTSAHTQAWAVDFTCRGFGSPFDVCTHLATCGIRFDQIIHEYGRWVHISFDPRMRGSLLTKRTGQNYETGIRRV